MVALGTIQAATATNAKRAENDATAEAVRQHADRESRERAEKYGDGDEERGGLCAETELYPEGWSECTDQAPGGKAQRHRERGVPEVAPRR